MFAITFNSWEEAVAYFDNLTIELQILVGVLSILLVIGTMSLVYQIVKGSFWLATEAVKGSFWLSAVSVYLTFKLTFGLPIEVFLIRKPMTDFWEGLSDDMGKIWRTFYKKDDKEQNKSVKQAEQHIHIVYQQPTTTTVQPAPQPAPQPVAAPAAQITVKKPSTYHCTNCGAPFTGRMLKLLDSRNGAFCEECGQSFQLDNGLPAPVDA